MNQWLRQCSPRALKNNDADDDPDALDGRRPRETVAETPRRASVVVVVVDPAGWTVVDDEEEATKTDG